MGFIRNLWGGNKVTRTQSEPASREVRVQTNLFRHLQRVRDIGPDLEQFIHQYIGSDTQSRIIMWACEKLALTESDHQQHSVAFTEPPVLFAVTTLPTDVGGARDWFATRYGGYTSYSSQSWNTIPRPGCSTWCHLIFGSARAEYCVQMAITSVEAPRLIKGAFMPVDLLTLEERTRFGL